ncbi:hypothetical protein Agabi119p4_7783 [Agaricus bisporus var. burnettii]|uniref:Secreted protein n=1 Tax=Agaricus bisporus var. burnettii TaxID=192524 RepID=A0A8H7C8V7_AGABI|nr:hypothetical protein Agabi119p4_7783 [Agaricus bisporus var. burnettii]
MLTLSSCLISALCCLIRIFGPFSSYALTMRTTVHERKMPFRPNLYCFDDIGRRGTNPELSTDRGKKKHL